MFRYRLEDYDYPLPKELIARHPAQKRDESKLLVLYKHSNKLVDSSFKNIINYFESGDLLILNDTKVLKARFFGKKKDTNAKIELLIMDFIHDAYENSFVCLSRPYKRLKEGTIIIFDNDNFAEIQKLLGEGKVRVKFHIKDNFFTFSQKYGHVPLPPYIKRNDEKSDERRYQTVYAKKLGAVAAPTAGLHFSRKLLDQIQNKGVQIEYITLHTGYGTFAPMTVDDIRDFKIHSEYFQVKKTVVEKILETKKLGKRIFAVGTTSVRTLEYIAINNYKKLEGFCDLYIYPSFNFKVIDAMITNFHLPKTSLIVLVSAFASYDQIQTAYKHAIGKKYHFFSYGDAMLILP